MRGKVCMLATWKTDQSTIVMMGLRLRGPSIEPPMMEDTRLQRQCEICQSSWT